MIKGKATIVSLVVAALMSACGGASLQLGNHAGGGITAEIDQPVTFGGGPVLADGGRVTLRGAGQWAQDGLQRLEGIFLMNPDENSGHVPGIVSELASEAFTRIHQPHDLVIEPGQEWYVVMTVSASALGTYHVSDVVLEYGSDSSLRVPMKMTLEVNGGD